MTLLGAVHVAFGLAALASGAAVLLRRKGTASHRRLGWTYAAAMLGLNGTAFLIYRLFGGVGPFHVAALASLVTLVGGLIPAIRRRPADRWVERHYYWMTYSYVGLLAATTSEIVTRLPGPIFWWAVAAGTLAVLVTGAALIGRQAGAALRPFRPAAGDEKSPLRERSGPGTDTSGSWS